uniref:ARAD1A11484p n=1 Tax=Blastobotrys adeninivorans TaxID=409370 RepID=A0A060T3Q6_BLAAD
MEIAPEVLEFEGPIHDQATRPLHLTNTTSQNLAYKIKTTAPKLYCVRPNASIIAPGQSVQVSIIRQGKDDGVDPRSHKDKFLVLSTAVEMSEVPDNFAEMWTEMEQVDKESPDAKKITSKKIRVVYQSSTNTAGNTSVAGESFSTPVRDNHGGNGHSAAGVAGATGAAGAAIGAGLAAAGAGTGGATTGASATSTTATSRSGADKTEKAEIDDAKEKIAQMDRDIKSGPQKSVQTSESKPKPVVAPKSSGVPVPVVMILVLLTFLIGWKFF